MSKINFRKSRIKKKYWIKFRKSSIILFLQKYFGCPELGENKAPLKTYLYLLFQNCFLTQKKFWIQVQEVGKIIQVLEFYFFKYSKVSKTNFKVKGLVVEWKLAARKSFESQLDIDL